MANVGVPSTDPPHSHCATSGFAFWPSLAAGCALTIVLYVGMAALLARWDIPL